MNQEFTPQEEPKVKVNLADAETVVCKSCQNQLFERAFLIKRLSALISPTGKEVYIPIDVMVCTQCGALLDRKL